ncbi:MAG: AAA family ATPase, partial [Deltaproteobacteria bacterium]|nr:AAA family ATPase [Deltaproteobacteria bacterium]
MAGNLVQFAEFELDRAAYQLRHKGRVVRLQRIPLDLLLLLAERQGQLVTREEIRKRIWGAEVFLDTESSINTAIRKLRRVLRDRPGSSRFIQTVPAKGYRFIAEVHEPASQAILNRPSEIALTDDESKTIPRSGSPTAERRHLTVLVCELMNSTSPAAPPDPEEWWETVADYHRAAVDVIERYGGRVEPYRGDAMTAYFGWPAAHDNDAERAAQAGLAIIEAIARLNQQPSGPKLSGRIGIDSGMMVVGVGASKEADVFGDVPNIAARTQAAAEPDMVVVTDATQRLISGLFVVEDRGAQSVTGIERSVQLYRLIRPSGIRGRLEAIAAARGLTRFVGRDEELRLLINRWERALVSAGQAVLIIGEAGIGKSRLVQHFHQQIAATPHGWTEAAASPFFQNTPFYPVTDMVRGLQESYGEKLGRVGELVVQRRSRKRTGLIPVGGPNGQSANGAFTKKETQVGGLQSALELDLPQIAQLFVAAPVEDPASPLASAPQRRRLLSTLVEWVLGGAQVMPVVIAIENLHWADPSTLELLELLIEQCAQAPLLLLFTARPEFRAHWRPGTQLVQATLNPLNTSSARAMVEKVAGQKTLSEATITAVVERTGGVPLFVEELTRAVLERGNMKHVNGEIPATLHDSLMARLDRLGTARETLQLGAVLGIEFAYDLLLAVNPLNEHELQRHLFALTEAELLYRRGLPPAASYQFKHALIRDAAYETLLKSIYYSRGENTTTSELGRRMLALAERAGDNRLLM